MPKLLQINVTANWGSTGKIAEQIGQLVIEKGWESYIAFGRYYNQSSSNIIKIGNKFDVLEHYVEHKLFDNEGQCSRKATKNLIKQIKQIEPDIIHLHNIHDHYLNYIILFDFLKSIKIPVIWTFHDCWAYTGGCFYYNFTNCKEWQNNCIHCAHRRSILRCKSYDQLLKKRECFTALNNLTIVPVSAWLEREISKSFFNKYPIQTICNGVDVNRFKPTHKTNIRTKYGIGNKNYYIGIASVWDKRKGLVDYIELSKHLNSNEILVLVGLTKEQRTNLPNNIIAIPRTQNISDLIQLYSESTVVLNLSYEETFGMTTVEGFACGTPGIVYNCTASPELISQDTGIIVDAGDIDGVYSAINKINAIGKHNMTESCRSRAVNEYNKDICFQKYLNLYNQLLTY